MFRVMKKLLTLLVSLLFVATAFASASKFADITQPELTAAIAAKSAVILDVNGTDSYKAGHIPGAVDYIANKDKLASLLPADKNALVVAYCGSPQCHAYATAAEAAAKLGYTNVKHFAPGIAAGAGDGDRISH